RWSRSRNFGPGAFASACSARSALAILSTDLRYLKHCRPMMTGENILCISSIDWDFLWQGHQEIMSTFAARGNRVLYIANTGVRRRTWRDLPRLRHRIWNWWRGTKGFREERPGLFVYSPVVLPFPYSRLARWINRRILLRALTRWMRATGFSRPITW